MDRKGKAMAGVHDSAWCHANDAEELRDSLSATMISMHKSDQLAQIRSHWDDKYPDADIPELPEYGTLNLERIKDSGYFFS